MKIVTRKWRSIIGGNLTVAGILFGALVTLAQTNQPPSVAIANPKTLLWPSNQLTLSALVQDDGKPVGNALTTQWSKVAGPGVVIFSQPTTTTTLTGNVVSNNLSTQALFTTNGTYQLQLAANDGLGTNVSTVYVSVVKGPAVAIAPTNLVAVATNQVVLNYNVMDIGSPTGALLSVRWSQTSGPGTLTFSPLQFTNRLSGVLLSNNVATTVGFTVPGTYALKLTATDGMVTNTTNTMLICDLAPQVRSLSATSALVNWPSNQISLAAVTAASTTCAPK